MSSPPPARKEGRVQALGPEIVQGYGSHSSAEQPIAQDVSSHIHPACERRSTHLNPYQSSRSPAQETMGPLKGIMVQSPEPRVGKGDNTKEKEQDEVRHSYGCCRNLVVFHQICSITCHFQLTLPPSKSSLVA